MFNKLIDLEKLSTFLQGIQNTYATKEVLEVHKNEEGNVHKLKKTDITALGIPGQDTVYTHPTNHSADMITETQNKTFITEQERLDWNNKLSPSDELTLGGRFKIVYNDTEDSLDIEVI